MAARSASFDFRAVLRDAVRLSKSPDPYVIAEEVAAAIPARARQEVLAYLLPDAIRQRIHEVRVAGAIVTPSSKRWRAAAAESAAREIPYYTEDGWKFLRDLNHADCLYIADGYQKRASDNEAFAKRFLALAEALRRSKVETVGELPEDEEGAA